MRRLLNQAANTAVKVKGSIFEIVYRRSVPRLGHNQVIGAIAHRQFRLIWLILHQESVTRNTVQRLPNNLGKHAPPEWSANSANSATKSNYQFAIRQLARKVIFNPARHKKRAFPFPGRPVWSLTNDAGRFGVVGEL